MKRKSRRGPQGRVEAELQEHHAQEGKGYSNSAFSVETSQSISRKNYYQERNSETEEHRVLRVQERQLEAEKVQEADSSGLSLDHILKTSIDLDGVAVKNIEQLLALGSKRLAQDFKDLLDSALAAVEQNADLLGVLREQLREH